MRVLDLVKPLVAILPEVQPPERRVSVRQGERRRWGGVSSRAVRAHPPASSLIPLRHHPPLLSAPLHRPTPHPPSQVPLGQKVFWTVACLLVYLVCTQMPLYGIASAKNADPFYIMRMILASSRCVARCRPCVGRHTRGARGLPLL